MAKERVPGQLRAHPRDDDDKRCDTIKRAWQRSGRLGSLKAFARKQALAGDQRARDWLHNKTVNTSKPNLGIGNTRKKKTQNNSPKKS